MSLCRGILGTTCAAVMVRSVWSVDDLVWYVAFGSNMDSDRLSCYLAGGRPEGASRTYTGARDPSPPRRAVPTTIPHRLSFGGRSCVWGGGVAFVEVARDHTVTTPAVAWLITVEQLADLIAQENGLEPPGPVPADLPGPGQKGRVAGGRYDMLVGVGVIDGHRAVVLTSGRTPPPNPPTEHYLAMIRRGRERWHPGDGAVDLRSGSARDQAGSADSSAPASG